MAERITVVYGRIDKNRSGIVEFRFDKDKWDFKTVGKNKRLRRKGALKPRRVIDRTAPSEPVGE